MTNTRLMSVKNAPNSMIGTSTRRTRIPGSGAPRHTTASCGSSSAASSPTSMPGLYDLGAARRSAVAHPAAEELAVGFQEAVEVEPARVCDEAAAAPVGVPGQQHRRDR